MSKEKNMKKNNIPILSIEDLSISFSRYDNQWNKHDLEVIHSLDVDVYEHEIVAVVGASGSGKSLLAHSVLGILPHNAKTSGTIRFNGQTLDENMQGKIRGKDMVLIPQSINFLDPLMKIGKQIKGIRGNDDKMKTLLKRYNLAPDVAQLYPFQLSGGMARRVLIATALTEDPRLIIADEPTPGLDISMAMETLNHFREMADEGKGVLLITHDIDLALNVADRIVVFYAGTTVEYAPVKDFKTGKEALRHPYTKAFFDALPQNDFRSMTGVQPYAGNLPKGCLFSDRCPHKTIECEDTIRMRSLRGGKVRCIHAT